MEGEATEPGAPKRDASRKENKVFLIRFPPKAGLDSHFYRLYLLDGAKSIKVIQDYIHIKNPGADLIMVVEAKSVFAHFKMLKRAIEHLCTYMGEKYFVTKDDVTVPMLKQAIHRACHMIFREKWAASN